MKNYDRYMPALLTLTRCSKELHSSEVTDLGKMNFREYWSCAMGPKLEGHSVVLSCADTADTVQLLEYCPAISNGCLVISVQMQKDADLLSGLFPHGITDRPVPGGILVWDHKGGMNLKTMLGYTQNLYTVLFLPGLSVSPEVLSELYSFHRSAGFMLISKNLQQEITDIPGCVSKVFGADYLIIHGAADTDLIAANLPQTKVSQPQNSLVMNFHNPSMPIHVGNTHQLMNRGGDCGKPHKLSLSLSQSVALVDKPIFDGQQLRQMRRDGVTAVVDKACNVYCTVKLGRPVLTLSYHIHGFFDRTAGKKALPAPTGTASTNTTIVHQKI